MQLDYILMDVFTTTPLSGNPLAVVREADGLLDDRMQAIANEFGLSETVFLTRPRQATHTAGVRIFTPRTELAFAGHPTVGAAAALALVASPGAASAVNTRCCSRRKARRSWSSTTAAVPMARAVIRRWRKAWPTRSRKPAAWPWRRPPTCRR